METDSFVMNSKTKDFYKDIYNDVDNYLQERIKKL